MKLLSGLRTPLDPGPVARARFDHVRDVLRLERWFPHVPLALLTLLLGISKVSRQASFMLARQLADWLGPETATALFSSGISGASRTVLGVFLLVMSVGLLFRSRLAWVIVVAMLLGQLALSLSVPGDVANPITGFNLLLLVLLLLAWRQFSRSSLTAGTLFAVTSVITLVTLAVLGSFELRDQFKPPIGDLTTALYFVVVTMSTVGYGDILPQTTAARMFVIALIILGITVFTASLSAVLLPLAKRYLGRVMEGKESKVVRANHYVIVGGTSLAENTAKALRGRGWNVTLIIEGPATGRDDPGMDVVRGDPSGLDTLRQAGADKAHALLALTDDDAANAFVILAMKELTEKVKTVALVNSARNLASVKRVRPDMVIAPYVVGGELLAMALSGEPVDGDAVVKQFLYAQP